MENINQVMLKGNRFTLVRQGDSEGDSGNMLVSILPSSRDGGTVLNGAITVGYCVRCGSSIARSFQWQDYWQTTPVVEILSVNEQEDEVTFKTKSGSIYTVTGW
jgi:hypothetical protein